MMEVFSPDTIAVLILGLLWIGIFWQFKMVRREMSLLGFIAIFLLPLTLSISATRTGVSVAELSALDLLFAFFTTGLAAVIYHAALGKEYHRVKHARNKKAEDKVAELWLMRLFLFSLIFVWGAVILILVFGLSGMYASLFSAVGVGIYMVAHRHNLLLDSLLSGLLMAVVMLVVGLVSYSITAGESLLLFVETDVLIFGIPLDLLLWAFALGIGLGPLYEYVRKLRIDA